MNEQALSGAKINAVLRQDEGVRRQRAKIAAYADLRRDLRREPTPIELDGAAEWLFQSGDVSFTEADCIAAIAAGVITEADMRAILPMGGRVVGGGPPAGDGLTRDRIIEAAIEYRAPRDGSWPTQATVAEKLGVTERRIRQVQGRQRWHGILGDAAERLAER